MQSEKIFKRCSKCKHTWDSRGSFLSDTGIELIGYQADFAELSEGLFLFNHTCGTTIAIKAQFFIDLHEGPVFRDRLNGSDECLGYCNVRDNLLPCPLKCECAYVRSVIQVVKDWPKVNV
jgi:hypothetical protein